MSAIADFRVIEKSKLALLKEAAQITVKKGLFSKKLLDNYWNFLDANSRKLKDFDWSGYIFANLLVYLEEKEINLFDNEFNNIASELSQIRGNSTFILTYEQKQRFAEKLNSANFDKKELISFNKEFSQEDNPELATAQIEGIRMLKESLESLTDNNQVVILTIS